MSERARLSPGLLFPGIAPHLHVISVAQPSEGRGPLLPLQGRLVRWCDGFIQSLNSPSPGNKRSGMRWSINVGAQSAGGAGRCATGIILGKGAREFTRMIIQVWRGSGQIFQGLSPDPRRALTNSAMAPPGKVQENQAPLRPHPQPSAPDRAPRRLLIAGRSDRRLQSFRRRQRQHPAQYLTREFISAACPAQSR